MSGTPFAAEALRGINLDLKKGSFTALVGPSGSGKSTLVQHFNGLLKPTAGRVLVDGVVPGEDRKDLLALRRRVGLVFQLPEEQFFAETVYDEIAFAPRNQGLAAGEVEGKVKEALVKVGLDYTSLKDSSPFHLSAGQKRLVALAAVLAMGPEVLILDEPTAGLDAGRSRSIFALLYRLNKEKGFTVIVISHYFEQIAPLADTLIVLNKGKLVMCGTPEEVFCRYEELKDNGLALPPVTEIMHRLFEEGLPVRRSLFTLEEACREILVRRKDKHHEP